MSGFTERPWARPGLWYRQDDPKPKDITEILAARSEYEFVDTHVRRMAREMVGLSLEHLSGVSVTTGRPHKMNAALHVKDDARSWFLDPTRSATWIEYATGMDYGTVLSRMADLGLLAPVTHPRKRTTPRQLAAA